MIRSLELTTLAIASVIACRAGADPVPPVEYTFVENTSRDVGVVRGQLLLVGKLDAAGNFVQSRQFPLGKPWSADGPMVMIINDYSVHKKVYEFRSGRLILGELADDGSFVPAAGSAVIKLEDYRHGPDAIPIWNLPGYFMKKEPAWSGKDKKK
jgi:hypothetical protein